MPKSETLLLRRWPCWPGPYSRRLTGLLGRPKTFSPIRRSSLYLALERFDMIQNSNLLASFLLSLDRTAEPSCSTRPPLHQGCGANCEGGHMAAKSAKVNAAGALPRRLASRAP